MAAPVEYFKACSAREVLEEFKNSGVQVAWPRLADLLKVPPPMIHRIAKRHEPEMVIREYKSLTAVLDYWEDNDPNHTWDVLCLALLSDCVYKELGASLYSKHVKPEEFTVDLVYEEIKDLIDDLHLEIAYMLIENSKRLREIWGDDEDKLTFEERTKRVIDHWMKNNPASSWLLLAKRLDCCIHGEHEIAAQELAAKIRDKYIPKVEERRAYGPPKGFSEERKILKEFSAQEAFKELTAVEDWFGLGLFLKIEKEELKEIEKRRSRDDDRKLDMLEKWIKTQPRIASWNNLAFALKKMPQHQSLAEDIEIKLAMQMQVEIRDKTLRSLYTDHFFSRLVESLCDDQTRSSLINQLASLSLISETDKETQLSSTLQDPRRRAISLLLFLNIEEKPQKLIDLMRAMSCVDKMKSLVDEMSAQYKAMEGPSDPSDQYQLPDIEGDFAEEVEGYERLTEDTCCTLAVVDANVSTQKSAQATEDTSEKPAQATEDTSEKSAQLQATEDTSEKSAQATEDTSEKSTQATEDTSEKSTQATEDTSEKSAQATEDTSEKSTQATKDTSEKSAQATEDTSEKSTQATEDTSEKSTQATEDTSEKSTQATENTSEKSTQTTEDTSEEFTHAMEDINEESFCYLQETSSNCSDHVFILAPFVRVPRKPLNLPRIFSTPTLLELISLKRVNGTSLNIIETISAKDYKIFGMLLLQDKDGIRVIIIERDNYQNGVKSVTMAIFQEWLTSDAPTRTYQHLIECLRQSELGALAKDIKDTIVEQA